MISILILLLTFIAPLNAMEEEPVTETTPLIHRHSGGMLHEMPPVLTMEDEESATPLFNGTRRFYNQEIAKKIRHTALKRGVCETALCTVLMAGCGAVFGTTVAALGGAGNYIFFGAGSTALCAGSACIASSMTHAMHGMQENANDPDLISWDNSLQIPEQLRTDVPGETEIVCSRASLEKLITHAREKDSRGRDDCILPWIQKKLSCYYKKEKQIITAIEERMRNNQTEALDGAENMSITHHELFYLLQDLSNYGTKSSDIACDYANLILLAQNGWIAFKKSDTYPTRCQMKYFDPETLPEKSKPLYKGTHGPAIYLPTQDVLDLVAYYKFNDDPFYLENDTATLHNSNNS